MKKVEELAEKYSSYSLAQQGFIEGYKKALEWTSVEYEFPEEDEKIIIKVEIFDGEEPIKTSGEYINGRFLFDMESLRDCEYEITHWKYIY